MNALLLLNKDLTSVCHLNFIPLKLKSNGVVSLKFVRVKGQNFYILEHIFDDNIFSLLFDTLQNFGEKQTY